MNQTEETSSLSLELAKKLLDRLVRKGLLNSNSVSAIESKIAEGKMQEEDWKLEFEKSLDLNDKT
ncbi:MAG: hypothetical protein MOB07_18185 [Acidobacteria bacterium]|nr:hypothetical protein [Acidobacteriota bacterium]